MPDNLFGVDGLAVDDGRDLAVRAARVKADAAAVRVTADVDGQLIGGGEVVLRADDDLQGALEHIELEARVKFPCAAGTVSVPNLRGDRIVALKIDTEAASRPEKHFDEPLCKSYVRGSESFAAQARLIDGDLAVIAFDSDLERAICFFQIRLCPHAEGNEPRIERGHILNRVIDSKIVHTASFRFMRAPRARSSSGRAA